MGEPGHLFLQRQGDWHHCLVSMTDTQPRSLLALLSTDLPPLLCFAIRKTIVFFMGDGWKGTRGSGDSQRPAMGKNEDYR